MNNSINVRRLFSISLIIPLMFALGSCNTAKTAEGKILVDGQKEKTLSFTFEGGEKPVEVISDGEWTLDSAEEWISTEVTPRNSSGRQTLTVKATRNGVVFRQTQLTLVLKSGKKAVLNITQDGAEKDFRSVQQIRDMYQDAEVTVAEELWMNASIISNFRAASDGGLNNGTSTSLIVVSDGEAGIEILLAEVNKDLALGDEVSVSLRGQAIKKNGSGVLRIAGSQDGIPVANVTKLGTKAVEAKNATVDEILAGGYESMYVAIATAQVKEADRGVAFVKNNSGTNIHFEERGGKVFDIFTNKDATFGNATVPEGSGTIKGIANVYSGNCELIMTSTDDFSGLTGERFRSIDDPKTFGLSESSINVRQIAGSCKVSVISTPDDIAWTANSSNSSEFRLSKTSGTGAEEITISYDANTSTTATKSSVITFTTTDPDVLSDSRTHALIITQSPVRSFGVANEPDMTIAAAATSASFRITGNVDWVITTDHPDFVPEPPSGNGKMEVGIIFPANETASQRVVTVTATTEDEDIAPTDRKKSVIFRQMAKQTFTFTVTPMNLELGWEASEIRIDANGNWTAVGSDTDNFYLTSWDSMTYGILKYTANTSTTQERTATITFTSKNTTIPEIDRVKVVNITQAKKPSSNYGGDGKPGDVGYDPDNDIIF